MGEGFKMVVGNMVAEMQKNGLWAYKTIEKAHNTSPLVKKRVKYRDKPEHKCLEDVENQYKREYQGVLRDIVIEISNFLGKKVESIKK